MDGELITVHCTNSVSETYHGDQWVVMELVVRGSESIRHLVNGNIVFEYARVQLDRATRMRSGLLRLVHQCRSIAGISPCRRRATRLRSERLSSCRLIGEP